jgi:hypothetical protein
MTVMPKASLIRATSLPILPAEQTECSPCEFVTDIALPSATAQTGILLSIRLRELANIRAQVSSIVDAAL